MFLILLVVILNTLNKIEIVTTPAIIENTVIGNDYNTPNNVRINKLFIKEGDNVKIGTKMATLDNHQSIYAQQRGAIHLNSSSASKVTKITVVDETRYSQLTFLIPAENIKRIKVGDGFYFRGTDGESIHGKIKEIGIVPDDFQKHAFYRVVGQLNNHLAPMAVARLNPQASLNVQEGKTSYFNYLMKQIKGAE